MRIFSARITNAVDGDTLDVLVDLGFAIFHNVRIRVNGINTQEMHDKDKEKKELAERAKKEASTFVGRTCEISVIGNDKYGRTVADIKIGDLNYGLYMRSLGLAVEAKYSMLENVLENQFA
jgi:micrococcal nuclease